MSASRTGSATIPLLPWPEAWGSERPRTQIIAALILVLFTTVVMVPYAVDSANSGDSMRFYFGIAGFLVGISFLVALAPTTRVRRKKLPDDIEVGHTSKAPGMRIWYLRSWRRALGLWLAVGTAFLTIRAWIFLTDATESDSNAISVLNTGGLFVATTGLIMIATFSYYLYSGARSRGFVSIGSNGIEQCLGRSTRAIDWDDIGDIYPCVVNNSHTVRITPTSEGKISVDTSKSLIDRWQSGLLERSIDVPVWVLGMDSALFLHAARYYWQHPAARNELASGAVIDRMLRGDLDAQP